MAIATKRIDLSKKVGYSVKSFRVRELNGEDVMKAATRCVDPSGKALEGALFGMSLRQQQVATAIIEVDDKPVVGPTCVAYFDWNMKTQYYVGKTFDALNQTSDEDDEDFQKQLNAPDDGVQSATSPSTP